MHEDNIANLREEALRLIQLELALLEKMKRAPGLLRVSADSQQTFDQVSADAAIKVLQGEAAKLEKLDMVLAVMNCTQLKSAADAQVRADLLESAEVARGRLYAMVNKFDQSDRNDMKANAVKQFVQELMSRTQGPVLQAEQIFPVSSRANRARHEVERHGSLGGGAGLPGAWRQPPGLPRGPAPQPSAVCCVRGQGAAEGGICEPSSRWMRRATTNCMRCFRASSPGY